MECGSSFTFRDKRNNAVRIGDDSALILLRLPSRLWKGIGSEVGALHF